MVGGWSSPAVTRRCVLGTNNSDVTLAFGPLLSMLLRPPLGLMAEVRGWWAFCMGVHVRSKHAALHQT